MLSDEKVAVKTFEKSKLTESHARKRVAREIRILKALEHPNIIKLYEVWSTLKPQPLALDKGDLEHHDIRAHKHRRALWGWIQCDLRLGK